MGVNQCYPCSVASRSRLSVSGAQRCYLHALLQDDNSILLALLQRDSVTT